MSVYVTTGPQLPHRERIPLTEKIQSWGYTAYCSVHEDSDHELDMKEAVDMGADYLIVMFKSEFMEGKISYIPLEAGTSMRDWTTIEQKRLIYELDQILRDNP